MICPIDTIAFFYHLCFLYYIIKPADQQMCKNVVGTSQKVGKEERATLRRIKLRLLCEIPPCIQPTLAVPGISLPGGGNPDRCDLIASLHPPPAALRLFAYRLRSLSRRAYGDYPVASAGDQQEAKRKHHPNGWCFFLAPPVGLEPTTLRLTAACSAD